MRVMELHAPLRIVQRSQGRTATAAAAYRAAERIECERTGQVHDYTRKRGVEHTEMHAVPGAPEWALDRAALWNAAEMREKHPRAQTAREIEVAFPHEFSQDQRREAGRTVAQMLAARYGSAVDIAWHEPGRKGDQRNYHAHVMFTGRAVTADGWAKNKRLALDDRAAVQDADGNKTTRGAEELKSLRSAVAAVLNDVAVRHKVQVCVEHLSFEDRGLDKEATQHMGPDATEMERRGEETEIGNKNRGIQARNEERDKLREERDNVIDFALARDKYRRRNPWEFFYSDTQHKRAVMVQALDVQFGLQERNTRAELASIREEQESRNVFSRLWSKITGRTSEENSRLQALSYVLSDIERKRLQAHEHFEAERRQRLEVLKKEVAAREAQDREEFARFIRRQKEEAAAMHHDSLEEYAQEKREQRIAEEFHRADALALESERKKENAALELRPPSIAANDENGREATAEIGPDQVAPENQAEAEKARRVEEFKERMRSSGAKRDKGTDRSVG